MPHSLYENDNRKTANDLFCISQVLAQHLKTLNGRYLMLVIWEICNSLPISKTRTLHITLYTKHLQVATRWVWCCRAQAHCCTTSAKKSCLIADWFILYALYVWACSVCLHFCFEARHILQTEVQTEGQTLSGPWMAAQAWSTQLRPLAICVVVHLLTTAAPALSLSAMKNTKSTHFCSLGEYDSRKRSGGGRVTASLSTTHQPVQWGLCAAIWSAPIHYLLLGTSSSTRRDGAVSLMLLLR